MFNNKDLDKIKIMLNNNNKEETLILNNNKEEEHKVQLINLMEETQLKQELIQFNKNNYN